MDTLDGSEWDVVIAGTGFAPALLALSLARSGKKVLHLDQNQYYGGDEAALTLSEAEQWASRFSDGDFSSPFSHATISQTDTDSDIKLASTRAYSLALAPHLIHARSALLPALVSSRIHNQLDFQAIGSFFVVDGPPVGSTAQPQLTRVPSGREDVFQDATLDLKAKRSLMKFLRFVTRFEEQKDLWEERADMPFSTFLQQQFGLPPASHDAIMALTLSVRPPQATTPSYALPRIARHLQGIGMFGSGFGAVLPKWGGLAEIAQVACRACAVGGGVYVLNKGINSVNEADNAFSLILGDGEKVTTTWLAGLAQELKSSGCALTTDANATVVSRSITIVSSTLSTLFPQTSEGGVTPAGAVVIIPGRGNDERPVYIFVHSSEAGECPSTQSVLYAFTWESHELGFAHLEQAVTTLLQSIDEQPIPQALWSMRYQQQTLDSYGTAHSPSPRMLVLPQLSLDLALEDSVLDDVKKVWQQITGEANDDFMIFEAREGREDEDGAF